MIATTVTTAVTANDLQFCAELKFSYVMPLGHSSWTTAIVAIVAMKISGGGEFAIVVPARRTLKSVQLAASIDALLVPLEGRSPTLENQMDKILD